MAFRWLPDAIRRNRRIERKIDPLVCALVGLAVRPVAGALSGWLLLSAVALFLYEFTGQERRRDRELDTIDGLIESAVQADAVERFETVQPTHKSEPTTGVPTGVGHDIMNHLKRRKK